MDDGSFRKNLLLSLQRALIGSVPCSLSGVTVGWEKSRNQGKEYLITIRFLFDNTTNEDDYSVIGDVIGEVESDFSDAFDFKDECVQLQPNESLNKFILKEWVFYRFQR